MPWSVLFVENGEIQKLGPFDSEESAMKAAIDGVKSLDLEPSDQYIYLLDSNHSLISLSSSDLESDGTN